MKFRVYSYFTVDIIRLCSFVVCIFYFVNVMDILRGEVQKDFFLVKRVSLVRWDFGWLREYIVVVGSDGRGFGEVGYWRLGGCQDLRVRKGLIRGCGFFFWVFGYFRFVVFLGFIYVQFLQQVSEFWFSFQQFEQIGGFYSFQLYFLVYIDFLVERDVYEVGVVAVFFVGIQVWEVWVVRKRVEVLVLVVGGRE